MRFNCFKTARQRSKTPTGEQDTWLDDLGNFISEGFRIKFCGSVCQKGHTTRSFAEENSAQSIKIQIYYWFVI